MMHYGVTATINLNAIAGNYRFLQSRAPQSKIAGVIKANAYGLGAVAVCKALIEAGCTHVYVALLEESFELRSAYPNLSISVLGGIAEGVEEEAIQNNITFVINDKAALENAKQASKKLGQKAKASLHVDTGMNRLGFDAYEWQDICNNPDLLNGLDIQFLISHLASSDEWRSLQNKQQLEQFKKCAATFPHLKKSFANSFGVLLGANYHFDECRTGRALWGMDAPPEYNAKLESCLTLTAPILMVRNIDKDGTAGYNATHTIKKGMRLATISAGYADGILRTLSNSDSGSQTCFYIGDFKAPILGRVSMDLIILDISHIPETIAHRGASVEIVGSHQSIDALATKAGTIGYELLTHIASRVHRNYIPLLKGSLP